MTKQMILGRVSQLGRADVEGVLDQAEDPYKMADHLIREYSDTIREADEALAAAIRGRRMLEQDRAEDLAAAAEWGVKARAASRRADELRRAGRVGEAGRFDTLARFALGRELQCERDAVEAEPVIAVQTGMADRLETGLERMRFRLTQLRNRRDELVARSRGVPGRTPRLDAIRAVDLLDPTGDLGRFEDKLRREEARASGTQQLAASTLDDQFESLDPLADDAEVDARLTRLKSASGSA